MVGRYRHANPGAWSHRPIVWKVFRSRGVGNATDLGRWLFRSSTKFDGHTKKYLIIEATLSHWDTAGAG